ncbi:MAG: DUF3488 and transglutaminase-like domain-containing protein [Candidatus Dormibacteria bacterium]
MSELALSAIVILAVVAAVAAVPARASVLVPAHGVQARTFGGLARTLPGDWVSLALALLLAVTTAAALAVTVLASLGAVGCLVAATGVLMAAASQRWLPPRALGIPVVLVGGIATAVAIVLQVAAGIGATGSPVSLLQQVLASPPGSQLLALLVACWATGAWVGWLAIRERSGALACAVPLVVLVADLVNIAPVLESAPFWPVAGATLTGVALVGWTHQEQERARWARSGVPWSGGQPARGLGIALGCALLVTMVALVAPPLNRTNISARFFHTGPHIGRTRPSPKIAAISGYSTTVVPGGPIRQVRAPVLSYRTSAPGGSVYLRGVVLTQFNSGNWYEAQGGTVNLRPGQLFPYQGSPRQGTAATEMARRQVSLTVTYLGTGAQAVPDLLYPGSPTYTPDLSARYRVEGKTLGHQLLTVNTVSTEAGLSNSLPQSQTITTYGTVSQATAKQLEAAGTNYPPWVQADAALPPEASFVDVNQLAADATAMAAGATNPYQIAINIQDALRAQEIYTLDPPQAPAGVWPIIYFLNHSHRGYCQYFASAMGAMLRTLGIPSRLVSGFGPGQEGRLKNGQWLITEADAHTWVQVYFPSYGWVNFEPTPDGFYQPAGASATTVTTPSSTANVPHPGVRPITGQTAPAGSPRPRTHLRRDLGWGGLGVVALAILAMLLGAGRWLVWVRTPLQLRHRLALPVRLARMGDPRCRTVTELAVACATVNRGADPEWEGKLMGLARAADQISFARPPAELSPLVGWATVRSQYPKLVWRAWRSGRRRQDPALRPTAIRLQRI